jgi:hypothetical protein
MLFNLPMFQKNANLSDEAEHLKNQIIKAMGGK